jgi:hypothetical protein
MRPTKQLAALAGLTISVLCSGMALADSPAESPSGPFNMASFADPLYLQASAPAQALPPTPQPLLMSWLDTTPIGPALDSARIEIYGHVEGSYSYNFLNDPAKELNLGRVFDIRNNRPVVNQVDLNFQRLVDLTDHQFDIGGRIELLYGTDADFIHSNGLLSGQDFFHGPEYQFDVPQAYVDVAVPLGNGVRLRLGKFLFFKQIDPNASVFYSHSFAFGSAFPFTLTGITAYYALSDQLNIEGGISRGWDQSTNDNNGSINGLARVRYSPSDRTGFTLAGILGPEDNGDNTHYRFALDLTASQEVGDNLTLLLDAVYGHEAGNATTPTADWYGAAGYGVYRINSTLSAAARLEFYRDSGGFTTGLSQDLYEATVGVQITPFPNDAVGSNLKLRPEIRYDYSSRDYFDGLTKHNQATVAMDAIFNF